ncbi:crotonase/enoyl-CoA hydratase family protein [Leucobacter rhizosphaerae]|uniref:Crotonase/enoyl-CoA hydratase family protein n=1 Tax=Leucobacter rhizosphaerae TaxID=2932245 RepID=A0ABY4FUM7_9MICO|nr:crotonase/enoyl-CoA hydratase family protein [Leucobacter rhizosphaerae]UOQ59834.1 crotonase/enoyl-CoA hydratase family protein [Leucobacter rhizosphaerae]
MSTIHSLSGPGQPVVCRTSTPHVLEIELNRPAARNAINDEVAQLLASCLEEFDRDPELRVAVVSGRGSGFCAGLDLKAFLAGETGMHTERGFAGLTSKPPLKPVIAAVEGFALAGGLEIALACDLIVAASDAKLGIPEVQRGLVADGGALLHLSRRVPYQLAMKLALTGEPISGEDALRAGLVGYSVPPGSAVDRARDIAERIARNAPLAVQATKQILVEGRDWSLQESWRMQDQIARPVWSSRDAEEGARAFAERRLPDYSGT